MKNKLSKSLRFLLPCLAGILLLSGLFYFADFILNGTFVDWFEGNYMITESRYLEETGAYTLVREPDYPRIKNLVFCMAIFLLLLWGAVTFLLLRFYSRKKVRQSVSRISGLINRFMKEESDSSGIFPPEYAQISAQMAEIKSTMLKNEQLLHEEAARKNDLITYLAHDLRTPLTSVTGYLTLLDEAPGMPETQKEKYIHIALDKAQRLGTLISEFFEITRYSLQQTVLEKETVDLYYLLVQLTDEFYPLLQEHGNDICLDVAENQTVYGDADSLARVFSNILKNAISYSYPDTEIRISVCQDDSSVTLSFQNKGPVIPSQKLERIFEKFFRLDESRASRTGGFGLGLAIAKEIVTLHGGTITAQSHDECTVFHVILPLRNSKISMTS